MEATIASPFDTLSGISKELLVTYPENTSWNDSPFNWVKTLPAGSKGTLGKYMALRFLKSLGLNSELDESGRINAGGKTVLTKMSMLWATGDLRFQNIRDTPNSFLLCLGLCPQEAYGWLIPNHELWSNGFVMMKEGLAPQHTGADSWICVKPALTPEWMSKHGGDMNSFAQVLKSRLKN